MNVLIIPSWYPTRRSPLSGIFIREQVEAIAGFGRGIRPIVSNWGFDDGLMPIRSLKAALAAIRWRMSHAGCGIRKVDGVWEAFRPMLSYSSRLIGERRALSSLVRVNLENFRSASRRFGPINLIHAHVSFPGGYVAKRVAELHGIPYVITEHMGPFPFPSMLDSAGRPRREIGEALRSASRCIAVSPALADRMSSFGFPTPEVIPNLVNEEEFLPGKVDCGRFVFLTVSSITRAKGVDTLLHGIALWNPPPDVEFHIVGSGPQLSEYQALARSLGIGDRVRWLGEVGRGDIPALYQSCGAFVMPSTFETFGMVYAEAIACGKPVVATCCGGPEFIVNENNGTLVKVGDTASLAKALEATHRDRNQYDPEVIRRDFLARFSRPAIVDKLVTLYQQVVQTNSVAAETPFMDQRS